MRAKSSLITLSLLAAAPIAAAQGTANSDFFAQSPSLVGTPASGGFLGLCPDWTDGTSENSLGFGNIGDGTAGYMQYVDCLDQVCEIQIAFGWTGTANPGLSDGRTITVCVWSDDGDGDPTTGLVPVHSQDETIQMGDTDTFISYPLTATAVINGAGFIGFISTHGLGEFPGAVDVSMGDPGSWFTAADVGTINPGNMNGNQLPLTSTTALGLPSGFLMRASDQNCSGGLTPSCFGDGSVASAPNCGCGNVGVAGEGCVNSTGAGAILTVSGAPSVSSDSTIMEATQITDQPGIFFQGDNELGMPSVFGDGIRCCGTNVLRWSPTLGAGNCASTDQPGGCGTNVGTGYMGPMAGHPGNGGLMAGDTRCVQYWYRDPSMAGPCGGVSGFNTSNAVLVDWSA